MHHVDQASPSTKLISLVSVLKEVLSIMDPAINVVLTTAQPALLTSFVLLVILLTHSIMELALVLLYRLSITILAMIVISQDVHSAWRTMCVPSACLPTLCLVQPASLASLTTVHLVSPLITAKTVPLVCKYLLLEADAFSATLIIVFPAA